METPQNEGSSKTVRESVIEVPVKQSSNTMTIIEKEEKIEIIERPTENTELPTIITFDDKHSVESQVSLSTLLPPTEISTIIKYFLFGFNILFWLLGGIICGVGLWAWKEKETFTTIRKITTKNFDPTTPLIIFGILIFIIAFTGCLGALRENTCLLLTYCIFIGMIFLIQIIMALLLYSVRNSLEKIISKKYKNFIIDYRDDPDMQNLIDWIQGGWLKCCGAYGYLDWADNEYFNCSSLSREACAVPVSCCKQNEENVRKSKYINYQCGQGLLSIDRINEVADKIYTEGCVSRVYTWIYNNLAVIIIIFVIITAVQILALCFATNLRNDIFSQIQQMDEEIIL